MHVLNTYIIHNILYFKIHLFYKITVVICVICHYPHVHSYRCLTGDTFLYTDFTFSKLFFYVVYQYAVQLTVNHF